MTVNANEMVHSWTVAGVRAFLGSRGWRREVGKDSLPVEFWEKGSNEVLVPLHLEAADTIRRWRDLVSDVAEYEHLDSDSAAFELEVADDDVFELRAAGRPLGDGSIALSDAARLVAGARDLVVSAACSTIEIKAYHGRSKPGEARQRARSVRMGQTRRGSYIVPIISSVPRVDARAPDDSHHELDIDVERELFPRRVMATLVDAINTVHQLGVQADRVASSEQLNQAIFHGVSGDLCLAISEMLKSPEMESIETTFRWSLATRPSDVNALDVSFPRDAHEPIAEMGKTLRDRVRMTEAVIYGFVSSLTRDVDDEVGTVRIKGIVDRRASSIKVTLPQDLYHVAIRAHDERRRVRVAGAIVRDGGGAKQISRVDLFEIEDYLFPLMPMSLGGDENS